MTNKTYSKIDELVERMGEPKHIGGLEDALEESSFVPFTSNVIKNVSTNQHGLKIVLNHYPLKDFVEYNIRMIGGGGKYPTFDNVLPDTINTIMWTSLENVLSCIGGGIAEVILEGNPTYVIEQCLGFDYMFTFNLLPNQDQEKHGEVDLRITQNGDYKGEILREDLIQAYAKHLRMAI